MPAPAALCTVDDQRLAELSGLVSDASGLWAMADGGRRVQVHRIDPASCEILETRTAGIDPLDPEDLARGTDGTLWVGDIGDNERDRGTVAVVELPAGGEARLHRLTYPDGPHDAEALLVEADGRPVVVTKDVGPAGIYRTAARPDGVGPTPLIRVGELALPASDTAGGPVGGVGSRLVTGAGVSADGRVVAVRSYTDAWLYPVPDGGDLATALAGTPRRIPLPGEPQGEAVAFQSDGTLLSGSEARAGERGQIRAVPGAVAPTAPVDPTVDLAADPAGAADPGAAPAPADPAPEWLPAAIGAGAAVALLAMVTGALALRGRRR